VDAVLLHQLGRLFLLHLDAVDALLGAGAVLAAAQLVEVDLVGPVGDAQGAQVGPHAGERGVLADAHGAVGLDGAVDDGQGHVGGEDLALGDLDEGALGVALVDLDRGVEHDELGRVDLQPRPRDPVEQHAVFAQRLAEGHFALVVEPRDHPFERDFGGADGPHGVVDAAGAEAALHDFVAAAVAEDDA